jgi:hypothetical protein
MKDSAKIAGIRTRLFVEVDEQKSLSVSKFVFKGIPTDILKTIENHDHPPIAIFPSRPFIKLI